jgi:RloB-like protein
VTAARNHAGLAAKRGPEEAFDEVWCIFDVEAPEPHGSLERALDLAEKHQIRCAPSNTCFELWILLHFGDQNGYLTTDQACSLLESRKCCGYTKSGKRFDVGAVMPLRDAAVERAEKLAARHTGSPPAGRNPWTTVHELIHALQN